MKSITVLAVTLIAASAFAAGPEEFLKKEKMAYIAKIDKADRKVEQAKEERDEETLAATKDFIKDLEKVKVYWTKKGKLKEALEYQNQIDELQKMLDAGKPKPPASKEAERIAKAGPRPGRVSSEFAFVKEDWKASFTAENFIQIRGSSFSYNKVLPEDYTIEIESKKTGDFRINLHYKSVKYEILVPWEGGDNRVDLFKSGTFFKHISTTKEGMDWDPEKFDLIKVIKKKENITVYNGQRKLFSFEAEELGEQVRLSFTSRGSAVIKRIEIIP